MEFGIYLLPTFLSLNILIFPIILWIIAVCLDHIEPFLPFVSDLGVLPPEASFFTFCMTLGPLLMAIFVFIRYESVKSYHQNIIGLNYKPNVDKFNKRSLISGISMSTGFLIVGCFRNSEGKFVQSIHNVGAVLGFGSAVCDMFFQSKLAFELNNTLIAKIRCSLTGLCLILALTYNILAIWSFVLLPDALLNTERRLKWNNLEDGYVVHVISTVLEWILISLLSPYFGTFISDFRNITFSNKIIIYKDVNQNINIIPSTA